MAYTLTFDSPGVALDIAGGKGANLAELTRAGFRVPPGFIVSTDAYRAFIEDNDLDARLLDLARSAVPNDPLSLESVSEQIRGLFGGGEMPAEIAQAIDEAYGALPLAPGEACASVAVRSSATAEDLPGLSFAGQQETYLNVVGVDALLDATRKCWASLWTARAIGYRARNNIPPDDVALAVVVQRMVPAETSGVLFTANPLTGRRDEIVIDASFGLGEAIVSGQVEPDHYVVDPHGWHISSRKLGAKALAIVPRESGGTDTIAQAEDNRLKQALPDPQILELARTCYRVAQHYGSPQDIEWAWAGGELYLLQARPITSLYPLPDLPYNEDDIRVYFSFNVVQGIVGPLTPMGRAAIWMAVSGLPFKVPVRELAPEAGGRLFIDITVPARDPLLRKLIFAALTRGDPAALKALKRLVTEGRIPPVRSLNPARLPLVLFAGRHVLRRVAGGLHDPIATRRRLPALLDEYLAAIRRNAAQAGDLNSLLTAMEADLARIFPALVAQIMPLILPSVGGISVVDRMLGEWLGTPRGAALALMRGLPGNVTTEMDLKLWDVAQAIRADTAAREHMLNTPVPVLAAAYHRRSLPPTAQRALDGFLDEYGMRAVAEIDLGRPRWREDPSSILQTLQSYLQLEDPELAPDLVFRRGAAEARRQAGEYVARVRGTRFGHLRARILRAAIRRIRALAGIRETPKLYIIKAFDVYRSSLLAHGRRLAEGGTLESADDIFFVPIDALKAFARGEKIDLRAAAASQRAEYEREKARRQLPHLLLSTGETFYEGLSEEGSDDLVGDPVSPGVAEGTVRVVLDPRGVRLEPGEILVCPATDPGWTPLFLTAGGLVMEVGGLVTHGSVVAREYGIPAVVAVHDATVRLHTGQRVRVDGSSGRITVLN